MVQTLFPVNPLPPSPYAFPLSKPIWAAHPFETSRASPHTTPRRPTNTSPADSPASSRKSVLLRSTHTHAMSPLNIFLPILHSYPNSTSWLSPPLEEKLSQHTCRSRPVNWTRHKLKTGQTRPTETQRTSSHQETPRKQNTVEIIAYDRTDTRHRQRVTDNRM